MTILGDVPSPRCQALTAGPHPACGHPSYPVSEAGVAGLRELSLQPAGIDGCSDWFSVNIFVNDQQQIEVVTLDLPESS